MTRREYLDKTVDALDKVIAQTGVMPCEDKRKGDSCLARERARPTKHAKVRAIQDWDPERMCSPCAAHWYAWRVMHKLEEMRRARLLDSA